MNYQLNEWRRDSLAIAEGKYRVLQRTYTAGVDVQKEHRLDLLSEWLEGLRSTVPPVPRLCR